jgi:hypothetical protein
MRRVHLLASSLYSLLLTSTGARGGGVCWTPGRERETGRVGTTGSGAGAWVDGISRGGVSVASAAGVSGGDVLDLVNLEPCAPFLAVLCVLSALETLQAGPGNPPCSRCLVPWPRGEPADFSQDMVRDIWSFLVRGRFAGSLRGAVGKRRGEGRRDSGGVGEAGTSWTRITVFSMRMVAQQSSVCLVRLTGTTRCLSGGMGGCLDAGHLLLEMRALQTRCGCSGIGRVDQNFTAGSAAKAPASQSGLISWQRWGSGELDSSCQGLDFVLIHFCIPPILFDKSSTRNTYSLARRGIRSQHSALSVIHPHRNTAQPRQRSAAVSNDALLLQALAAVLERLALVVVHGANLRVAAGVRVGCS